MQAENMSRECFETLDPTRKAEILVQEMSFKGMLLSGSDREKFNRLTCDTALLYLSENRGLKRLNKKKNKECRTARQELCTAANFRPNIREALLSLDLLSYSLFR